MDIDNALKLMKVYVRYSKFIDSLEDIFGIIENKDIDYCYNEMGDIILDLLDIPEDRTVEEPETGFCRDWFYNKIFDMKTDADCIKVLQEITHNELPKIFLD